MWSEKTTVCRIFSCKRTNTLEAFRRRLGRQRHLERRVARGALPLQTYVATIDVLLARDRNFSFYDPRASGRKQVRRNKLIFAFVTSQNSPAA
jgi:hypothetical protein